MRKLNKKQRTMVEDFYKHNPNEPMINESLLSAIEKVNWYETAHMDIQRYYDDCKAKEMRDKQYNSDYAKFKRGEPITTKGGMSNYE